MLVQACKDKASKESVKVVITQKNMTDFDASITDMNSTDLSTSIAMLQSQANSKEQYR